VAKDSLLRRKVFWFMGKFCLFSAKFSLLQKPSKLEDCRVDALPAR